MSITSTAGRLREHRISLNWFDLLAWSFAAAVCLNMLRSIPLPRPSVTWHVSTTGSDLWGDGSSARPFQSIQYACDKLGPGDRVVVGPGVYRERIYLRHGGQPGRPVTLQAESAGSVVVTAASTMSEYSSVVWRDEGDGIYSADTAWPIYEITSRGMQLFRISWGGVELLREFAARSAAMGAFCSDGTRLFVGLPQGAHPEGADLVWNRPVPPPREWGDFKSANVWVEADHVVISGLRLEFGLGAAVRVWNAEHLTITDCEFTGCTHGVLAGAGLKPARNLVVERCWYQNSPQADWAREWLDWNEIYRAYSTSTLCTTDDRPVSIHDNLITDFGDGLRVSPRADAVASGTADISGNWLAFGTDDAFELDGAGQELTLENNLVIDVHEGVSLSPLTHGPVRLTGNVFWNPPWGLNGSQLKFIPPHTKRGSPTQIRGALVDDNIFCGDWLSWRGDVSVSMLTISHNLFETDRQLDPPWPTGTVDHENLYRGPRDPQQTTIQSFATALENDSNPDIQRRSHLIRRVLSRRPGPAWLDWNDHPSTQRLAQLTQEAE